MRRDLIVIGASAGGVEALKTVVASLPADLPATVLVVLHVPSYGGSRLPAILNRVGTLPARHPSNDEKLAPGVVLVAPPDQHLVTDGRRALVTNGPRENGHRPAIDALFRTAARSARERVIGVVLSGVLYDGAAGLSAVAACGGVTVVQDPRDALFPAMPLHAMARAEVNHAVPADEIGALLAKLCREEIVATDFDVDDDLSIEADMAMMEGDAMDLPDRPGRPSGFSCPDCSGVLWEIDDGDAIRYRCRVGHAWSAEGLLGEQGLQLEQALWIALRGLEEKAALADRLRSRATARGHRVLAGRYAAQSDEASRAARTIRSLLEARLGSAQYSDIE